MKTLPLVKAILVIVICMSYCYSFQISAQSCQDVVKPVRVAVDAPSISVGVTETISEDGGCGTIIVNGQEAEGSSNFSLNVRAAVKTDNLVCLNVNAQNPVSSVAGLSVSPTLGCEFHIVNVTGQINSYMLTNFTGGVSPPLLPGVSFNGLALEKKISGGVAYDDLIEVCHHEATTIELPLGVSADLVAVQTFCDPDKSEAKAMAELTATLGGQTVSLKDSVIVNGAFLAQNNPNESAVVSLSVPAGCSTYVMSMEGELSVTSTVLAVSPLLTCASNAVATAGNSIDVYHFTGENGGPLPAGISIVGLDTGVNYADPSNPIECLNITTPDLVITDADCGLANGTAEIVNPLDTLTYSWSTGDLGNTSIDLAAGIYFVSVTDPSDCTRVFPVVIDDLTLPEISLPIDTILYEGETIALDATDVTDNTLIYDWSTGETTPIIEVTTAGVYSLTVTDVMGCEFGYSVEVITPSICDPCEPCSSFNFEDFSDVSDLTLVSSASVVEDFIRLTPASTNRVGAAWYTADKHMLADGFTTEFDFRMTGSVSGADGIVFLIQNDGPDVVGASGGGIGYYNLINGVAIEFDTWGNSGLDPDGNHISIQPPFEGQISRDDEYSLGVASIPGSFNDSEIHQVKIDYRLDTMYIYYDDFNTEVIKSYVDLDELIEGMENGVWIGFTAGTGLARNNHEILNWKFGTSCYSNCEDGIQNGTEENVDCGPDCVPCVACPFLEEIVESIECLADGSYTVQIDYVGLGDGTDYMIYEQDNLFGEIDTIGFTDQAVNEPIIVGPYEAGRSYYIVIEQLNSTSDCSQAFIGTSDCEIPCDLSVSINAECAPSGLMISGEIIGGTPPYSVASGVYNTVLFPNEGNLFSGVVDASVSDTISFVITDFNQCEIMDSIIVEEECNDTYYLSAKVLLQGPFVDDDNDLMRDDLRWLEIIPSTEPYSSLPSFTHVGAGGNEVLSPSLLLITGEEAIVDWVFLELRDEANPSDVVATRSALVRRNGEVIDIDGSEKIAFSGIDVENYHLAIRHRNHLGAMTSQSFTLEDNSAPLLDFSAIDFVPYGTHAQVIIGGQQALWAGNVLHDSQVIFQGPNNDVNMVLLPILSNVSNPADLFNYIHDGYFECDVNLNGECIFQGPNNDVNPIVLNVLLYPDNPANLANYIIEEQLP